MNFNPENERQVPCQGVLAPLAEKTNRLSYIPVNAPILCIAAKLTLTSAPDS